MNLFFGKISKEYNTKQITEGFYEAPKGSSWFGELKVGDYVFIIGGGKIQFWKADKWDIVDGKDRFVFEILNDDLGIDVNQFISLNFMNLSKALIVLSSRSARNKAFFKIVTNRYISIDDLVNKDFYKNSSLYRKIRVVDKNSFNESSQDIQLLEESGELNLINANYFEPNVFNEFRNNLKYYGQGAKLKDNVLKKIAEGIENHREFDHQEIGIRAFYDTFFCDYKEIANYYLLGAFWDTHDPKDLTDNFVRDGNWLNGYEDKFIKEIKAIPVGSNIAIKSAYVRNHVSVMMIKARGRVTKNKRDGQNLEVEWEKSFKPFEVNFGGYRTTVKAVTKKEHIEEIWPIEYDSNNEYMNTLLYPLLKFKKQIIFQGPPGTGKTRTAKDLAHLLVPFTYDVIISKIVPDLKIPSVAGDVVYVVKNVNVSSKKISLIREKGTEDNISFDKVISSLREQNWEKTIHQNDDRMSAAISKYLFDNYFTDNPQVKLLQFHPSFTYEDFVRGIEADTKEGQLIYQAKNKSLILLANEALLNPEKSYVLILDEINRANLSAVLGELIYALEYRGESVDSMYEVGGNSKLILPDNLYIIGTMNTADRSVGHIDYAIRRRFAFVDVLPKNLKAELSDDFEQGLFNKVANLFVKDFDPQIDYSAKKELLKNSSYLSEEFRPEDVWLGHSYFIKKKGATMEMRLEYEIKPILIEYIKDGVLKEEARKVIMALPNDVSTG